MGKTAQNCNGLKRRFAVEKIACIFNRKAHSTCNGLWKSARACLNTCLRKTNDGRITQHRRSNLTHGFGGGEHDRVEYQPVARQAEAGA